VDADPPDDRPIPVLTRPLIDLMAQRRLTVIRTSTLRPS
jgi:hypothetical protein